MKKHSGLVSICAILVMATGCHAQETGPWHFDLGTDLGYLSGDMNYQIGGNVSGTGGSQRVNDPLSKLEYPLNTLMLSANGGITYSDLIETRVSYSHNLNDPKTKMKDSDWTDDNNPSQKDIYSESDAALKASVIDASVKIWAFRKYDEKRNVTAAFGPGVGYYYQKLRWDVSNVDQWYPLDPTRPHDTASGLVMTYDAKIYSPYVAVYGKINLSRFLLEGNLGWCFVTTNEVDDHVLRSKVSTTDGTGHGVKANASARYLVSRNLYLLAAVNVFNFTTTGTQHQQMPGAEFFIEEKSKSTQFTYSLGAGYRF